MHEIGREAGRTILDRIRDVAEAVVARQYELQPEVARRYGGAGRDKCLQDAEAHLSYLAEAVQASSPELFSDYIDWVRVLLTGLGIPENDLVVHVCCLKEVLREVLDREAALLVDACLDAGLERLSSSAIPPPCIEPGTPHAELAQEYLDALLTGKRNTASRLVMEALEGGVSVRDIYLRVFQPTQYEIGRLWQLNRITVAQEHFCTAATQLIMSQLYPHIFRTERAGLSLVASSVSGELHEIGVRMVADFFEMEGWDTYYLGANTPAESIVRILDSQVPDLLALSATMTFHVSRLAKLIERVRCSDPARSLRILVGGYPFNVSPGLWKTIGADGCARDAGQALEVARRLLG